MKTLHSYKKQLNPLVRSKWVMGKGGSRSKAGGGGGSATQTTTEAQSSSRVTGDAIQDVNDLQKRFGISKAEAQKIADSIESFTGNNYKAIREADATGEGPFAKDAQRINDFLDRAPLYKGDMHRGLAFDDEASFNRFMKGVETGEMKLDRMASFTQFDQIAKKFATGNDPLVDPKSFQVVLTVKDSKKAVDIMYLSKWGGEEEVLAKKGTRYKVGKVTRKQEEQGFDDKLVTVVNVELTEL